MKPNRRSLAFGFSVLFAIVITHRLWMQHRPVPVMVGSMRPLTKTLQNRANEIQLHLGNVMPTDYEHATPYDVSTDKKVSSDELNRIRKIMAWKVWWPYRLKLMGTSKNPVFQVSEIDRRMRVLESHLLVVSKPAILPQKPS